MASEKQIAANRQNAQRSTGPRTTQGKLTTSQNALKHGLTTDKTIIRSENQAEYDFHRAQLLAEFAPSTPIEMMLVDRAVNLSWRLKRTSNLQNLTFDALDAPETSSLISRLTRSILAQRSDSPLPDSPDPSPDSALGQMIIKDFSNTRVLERLLMYERRIEHSLYKTIMEIQRLNMIKSLDSKAV